MISDLQRRRYGGTFGLRAVKALNVAVPYLDLKILSHAGFAVNVLTLLKAEAAGAQLLHEADPTAEHLGIKRPLTLRLVKVQELR